MTAHPLSSREDELLDLVRRYPTAGYGFYREELSKAGVDVRGEEGVRRRLRDLGLGTKSLRAAWVAEQSRQGGDSAVSLLSPPAKRRYFLGVEETCDEWYEEHAPDTIVTLDFSWSDRPIALVHSSDWHGGLKSVNYRQLRADNGLVCGSDGAYMVAAGDLIDNTKHQRKSAGALYATALSPDEQWEWLDDVTHDLRASDKIASVIVGNHEHWDVNEAGVNSMRRWCRGHDLPYHGHGGVFRVLVGDQEYYALLRHEYIGGGGKNKTLGPINMYERFPRLREAAHLDWTYTGHLHFNLQYPADHAAGECHHLRGGSYQRFSDWVDQKVGVQHTTHGAPTVILSPREHKVQSFKGNRLDEAMEYLAFVRSKSTEGAA